MSESGVCGRQIPKFKVDPRSEIVKTFIMAETHNIDIQMKRKELTNIFMMISNEKPLCSPWFIHKYFSASMGDMIFVSGYFKGYVGCFQITNL